MSLPIILNKSYGKSTEEVTTFLNDLIRSGNINAYFFENNRDKKGLLVRLKEIPYDDGFFIGELPRPRVFILAPESKWYVLDRKRRAEGKVKRKENGELYYAERFTLEMVLLERLADIPAPIFNHRLNAKLSFDSLGVSESKEEITGSLGINYIENWRNYNGREELIFRGGEFSVLSGERDSLFDKVQRFVLED